MKLGAVHVEVSVPNKTPGTPGDLLSTDLRTVSFSSTSINLRDLCSPFISAASSSILHALLGGACKDAFSYAFTTASGAI